MVINKIFDSVKIKEQGYNSCLAVLKLANKFSNNRLENACELAKVKCPRYHHLNGILINNQDLIWMSNKDSNKKIDGENACSSKSFRIARKRITLF